MLGLHRPRVPPENTLFRCREPRPSPSEGPTTVEVASGAHEARALPRSPAPPSSCSRRAGAARRARRRHRHHNQGGGLHQPEYAGADAPPPDRVVPRRGRRRLSGGIVARSAACACSTAPAAPCLRPHGTCDDASGKAVCTCEEWLARPGVRLVRRSEGLSRRRQRRLHQRPVLAEPLQRRQPGLPGGRRRRQVRVQGRDARRGRPCCARRVVPADDVQLPRHLRRHQRLKTGVVTCATEVVRQLVRVQCDDTSGYHADGNGGCTTDPCLPNPCTEPHHQGLQRRLRQPRCSRAATPATHDQGPAPASSTRPAQPNTCSMDGTCAVQAGKDRVFLRDRLRRRGLRRLRRRGRLPADGNGGCTSDPCNAEPCTAANKTACVSQGPRSCARAWPAITTTARAAAPACRRGTRAESCRPVRPPVPPTCDAHAARARRASWSRCRRQDASQAAMPALTTNSRAHADQRRLPEHGVGQPPGRERRRRCPANPCASAGLMVTLAMWRIGCAVVVVARPLRRGPPSSSPAFWQRAADGLARAAHPLARSRTSCG